jgi:hypothetical protein
MTVAVPDMPYVVCPRCDATSYVARSWLTRAGPCPICEEPLTDTTRVVWPARPGPIVDPRGR